MIENIQIYEMPVQSQNLNFQIYEVEGKGIVNKDYPHKTKRPHRHSYYEICIFTNGAGKHEIDFETHEIQSSSIHFITPGQVHLISREEDYHGYLLVFSSDFYNLGLQNKEALFELPFFNNNSSVPILNLNPSEFLEFKELIDNLKNEYGLNRDISKQVIRAYLHIFLTKSKYYFSKYNLDTADIDDPNYGILSAFRRLVEKNFKAMHKVQEYADIMKITPIYLNKVVGKMSGMNPSDHILNRLILEVKRMLIYTQLSNKEIAHLMHYEDPSYFSRIFKKKTGYSPSEFRIKFA